MWHGRAARSYRIALDLEDLDLRDALAELLDHHPDLTLGEPADVVITDRTAAPADRRILRLGGDRLPGTEMAPGLILAAAHVMASGFDLVPSHGSEPVSSHPQLSRREREVLALLVEGAPNKLIARNLDVSVSTAKFHVAAVLQKIGARNRAEAVAIALRDGLASI